MFTLKIAVNVQMCEGVCEGNMSSLNKMHLKYITEALDSA